MSLPDFLCIGAQKAGTSWLYKVLNEHPNVWLSPIKELHYFDRAGRAKQFSERKHRSLERRLKQERKSGNRNRDYIAYLKKISEFETPNEAWYRHVFSWQEPDASVKGEITPSYLELDDAQIAYARSLLGNAKIMVLVRSPLERELSQIRMAYERAEKAGEAPENEEDWLRFYRKMLKKFSRGSYSEGIPLWQKHFGAENVLILPFGDVRDKPQSLIVQIESFLGVPHFDGYEVLEKQVHISKKIEIPAEVVEKARKKVVDEEIYLQQTFGEEFFRKTK